MAEVLPDAAETTGTDTVSARSRPAPGPRAGEASEPASPRRASARALAVGAAVAPAVPLGATVALEWARGWRPTSDDAAIAWRAWDVFTAHAPLLGAYNDATVSAARPVFDLGPLEYYLLALPDRLDPVHGVLWGSAIVAAVLAGCSVEAARRIGGLPAAIAASVAMLGLVSSIPALALNLVWNPFLGLFAFAASLVFAVAVATGRTSYLPAATFAAALAAECHLVFAAGAVAALVVSLLLGLWARSRRNSAGRAGRHVAVAFAVGLGAVLPPVVQQLADARGNLAALFGSLGGGAALGEGRGLAAIGHSAIGWPLWARPAIEATGPHGLAQVTAAVLSGPAVAGAAVIGLVALAGFVDLARGARRLAALCLVGACAAGGLAATLAAIPLDRLGIITYVDVALWPVGMLLDAAILAHLVLAVCWCWRRVWATREHRGDAGLGAAPARTRRAPAGGLAPVAGGLGAAVVGAAVVGAAVVLSLSAAVPAVSRPGAVIGGWAAARAIGPLAARIERATTAGSGPNPGPQAVSNRGPEAARETGSAGGAVVVEPAVPLLPDGLPAWSVAEGLAYELKVSGMRSHVLLPMAPELGTDAMGGPVQSVWLVEKRGRRFFVRRAARARPMVVLDMREPR